MASWQEEYKRKLISLDQALDMINNGDQIITGLGGGEARNFLRNVHRIADRVQDVTISTCLPVENYEFFMNPQYSKSIYNDSWFLNGGQRKAYPQGAVSFIPNHLHLAISKRLFYRKCNIFFGTATPPDKHGYMSLSLSVTYEPECIENADLVIIEVNDQLPRTFGDTVFHVSKADYFVEHSEAPPIVPNAVPTEKDRIIGKYIADLVDDGATIQLGIGGIPNAVGKELFGKKDLGVHTEMFVDGMIDLIEAGTITGSRKTLVPERIVTTFALGGAELYKYLDDNPGVEFHRGSWTNDPHIIGKNYKMTSINTTMEIDLTGQCASESIGPRQYTGTGGQSDTATGAQNSVGGKSIIALHSTTQVKDPVTGQKNTVSKITPMLPQGSIVSLSRNDVDYVVTEYGVVNLRGTSIRDRVKLLISIAHPDFRPWLQDEAKRLKIM